MKVTDSLLERKLEGLTLPLAVVLPDGHRIGVRDAAITIRLKQMSPLAHIAAGEVGKVAQDYVEETRRRRQRARPDGHRRADDRDRPDA